MNIEAVNMELLNKAMNIGKKTKFTVRIYENDIIYTQTNLTYIELGIYLVSNANKINIIHIHLKQE